MGSAKRPGPCSSSRPPQPARPAPPRVPTDLSRCRAQTCATPRVCWAQPRASQRSSARTEPPRPAGTVPPAGHSGSCPERRPHGPQCAGQRPARLRRKRSGTPGRRAGRAPRTAAVPGRAAHCLTDSPSSKSAAGGEAEQPMAAGGRGGSGAGDPGSVGAVGPEGRCRLLRMGRRQRRLLLGGPPVGECRDSWAGVTWSPSSSESRAVCGGVRGEGGGCERRNKQTGEQAW